MRSMPLMCPAALASLRVTAVFVVSSIFSKPFLYVDPTPLGGV
jgi:hypothetical protein